MNIRLLKKEDWQSWKSLRLEALKESPESFNNSFEETAILPDEEFKGHLTKNDIFGAFIDEQLIGSLAYSRLTSLKKNHIGLIWGVYMQPAYRRQGIIKKLLETVVSHASLQVLQLYLQVTTTNNAAITLYEKYGFKVCGTEPKALKINEQFYDEYLMILEL
jgi:RimJ/RimL family protein N-acetyltransferase